MDTNTVLIYVSGVLSVASIVLGIINHKRIVSDCCGKKYQVGLDISSTEKNNDIIQKDNVPVA
jgi:hypothetical protein